MGDVEQAVAAYKAAQEAVKAARDRLRAEIIRELDAGVKQADLARRTGYTRETLRRIARRD
jgi:lambda repressor-like predicted transcriptional regulator